jgi:glycosyltransferase involved in cell wall biosynthesis
LKVLHIIPSYCPTKAHTGPPLAVHKLCRALREIGVEVRVATTDSDGRGRVTAKTSSWIELEGVPVYYGRRWGWSGDFSPRLAGCIGHEVCEADIVHVTAVFSWPLLVTAPLCGLIGVPLINSPRGSLDKAALDIASRKKALFLSIGGERALKTVAGFHATSEMERNHILGRYPSALVGIVPNGVDMVPEDRLRALRQSEDKPFLLYLGRLHPKKNLPLLLKAWARLTLKHGEVSLCLAGPNEGRHEAELRKLCEEMHISKTVTFAGAVEGPKKDTLLANARALVLPSRTENFGNVVAEALAHGTPVIASTGTPWEGLISNECGWWVRPEETELAEAMNEALSMSKQELDLMGMEGREWMRKEYSWATMAGRMAAFYQSILSGSRI